MHVCCKDTHTCTHTVSVDSFYAFFIRRYVRVGVVNGIIYAIGGYDGSAHLNTVECFDPMTNAWKPVASMASRRSSAGVAVLNDMLYVVGESHAMSKMVANIIIVICINFILFTNHQSPTYSVENCSATW